MSEESSRKQDVTRHPAIITGLSISGFKSFAHDVQLDILPGLTGIVGPNGCGKSNIVDSLRWVMGESSARALRGGESDDLIFAGTGTRPARNLARVSLRLSQAGGLAPAPFDKSDELEIERQAERGSGSVYRINQKVMRARDVQTIFADLASGARSSSIISQNRVGQLISAKPEERRLLLEEAAGITGLHVRRHDAEIKLRQAEANLERAEERRQQLEERLAILEGQSQQAQQYRKLSEDIRQNEYLLLAIQHKRAALTVEKTRQELEKNSEATEALTRHLKATEAELSTIKGTCVQQEEKTATYRQSLEEKRLQLELVTNNLHHAQKHEEEHYLLRQQLENDLQQQEALLQEADKNKTIFLQQHKALEKELETLRQALPDLTSVLEALSRDYARQQEELEKLKSMFQQESLSYETAKNQHETLARRLVHEEEALALLTDELGQHIACLTEHQEQKPDEKPDREALALLTVLEAEDQQQHVLLQEARLEAELAVHRLKESEARAAELQQRQKNLQNQAENITTRLEHDQEQIQQQQAYLLSDQNIQNLENDVQKTRQALNTAREAEKQALLHCEQAEQLWGSCQIQAQENQQRKTLLYEEHDHLQTTLLKQTERYEAAVQTYQHLHAAQEHEDSPLTSGFLTKIEEEHQHYTGILEQQRQNLEEKEALLKKAEKAEAEAKKAFLAAESLCLRHKGEYEGLSQSLGKQISDYNTSIISDFPSLAGQINFPSDLARALASALTEGIEGVILPEDYILGKQDIRLPMRAWRPLEQNIITEKRNNILAGLPALAELIEAPPVLARALKAVFLTETEEDGLRKQPHLFPGQSLVHRNGMLWRWDGFIRHADIPSPEAVKLVQTRRLNELTDILEESCLLRDKARKALNKSQETLEERQTQYREIRERTLQTEQDFLSSRQKIRETQQDIDLHNRRLEQAQHDRTLLEEEKTALEARIRRVETSLAQLPQDNSALENHARKVQETRETLEKSRFTLQDCQTALNHQQQTFERACLHHQTALHRLEDLATSRTHLLETQKRLATEQAELTKLLGNLDLDQLKIACQTARKAQKEKEEHCQTLAQNMEDIRRNHDLFVQKLDLYQQQENLLLTELRSLEDRHHLQEKRAVQYRQEKQEAAQHLADLPRPERHEPALQQKNSKLQTLEQDIETARNNLTENNQRQQILQNQEQALEQQIEQQEKTCLQSVLVMENIRERLDKLQSQKTDDAARNPAQLANELKKTQEEFAHLEQDYEQARRDSTELLKNYRILEKTCQEDRHKVSQAHEMVIRLTERLEQAEQGQKKLRQDTPLPEQIDPAPIKGESADLPPENFSFQAENTTRHHLRNLQKQREALGAVNLCAEEEHHKASEIVESLSTEHNDLTAAIARLRSGIHAINKEGRGRLLTTFEDINRYFQKLFTLMFGGGTAHLQMVGHDDPLEAGIEIFAQPPGKKLATLSLLSGGEQALTALSLIFAAFHCTPSPICVLDEVDAPLDDANVERFCTLLGDMVTQTKTHFLVVTHHQLTMARMDRLFGITMQERGISRILSVNLTESLHMAETILAPTG